MYLKHKTWLTWNGKRVRSESCKHCKRLTTKTRSIKKAFSSSFAGALRAPAQRFELGFRSERLSRGRAQRIASSRAKWNEHGLKMLPRGLPNRSKIAPRWLPGGSRAPPESANGSGDLSCSFFWPLGRLSGRSWVALGRSWRSLGASWAVPGPPGALLGAIFVTQGPPLGPVWVSFSDAFGKTRKP